MLRLEMKQEDHSSEREKEREGMRWKREKQHCVGGVETKGGSMQRY